MSGNSKEIQYRGREKKSADKRVNQKWREILGCKSNALSTGVAYAIVKYKEESRRRRVIIRNIYKWKNLSILVKPNPDSVFRETLSPDHDSLSYTEISILMVTP